VENTELASKPGENAAPEAKTEEAAAPASELKVSLEPERKPEDPAEPKINPEPASKPEDAVEPKAKPEATATPEAASAQPAPPSQPQPEAKSTPALPKNNAEPQKSRAKRSFADWLFGTGGKPQTPAPASAQSKPSEPASKPEPAPKSDLALKPEAKTEAAASPASKAEESAKPAEKPAETAAPVAKTGEPAPTAPKAEATPAPAAEPAPPIKPPEPTPASQPAPSPESKPEVKPVPQPAPEPVREFKPHVGFEAVPFKERDDLDELYSYRKAFEPEVVEPQPGEASQPGQPGEKAAAPPRSSRKTKILIGLIVLLFAGLAAYVVMDLLKPVPPVAYVDLGNMRHDAAGMAGRLIAHWGDGPTYQLSLDPLDSQNAANFQLVTTNPQHPLAVIIRLKNAAGLAVCQKEIIFPVREAQPQGPQLSSSGDTVENIVGTDSKITEIRAEGPLNCSEDAYKSLVAWDFVSNNSTADGNEWKKEEDELKAQQKAASAHGSAQKSQRLPAPIEGDDVIVGDNPGKGLMETSAGRTFLVGAGKYKGRAPEWQTFPAAIHFRCDIYARCTLSRPNSNATLEARLIK
jgi:hypothetical protein